MVAREHSMRICFTKLVGDSPRESSVLAGGYEQTDTTTYKIENWRADVLPNASSAVLIVSALASGSPAGVVS